MNFFAAVNTVTRSVEPSTPWEFKPTEKITAQILADKESRQDWYNTLATRHNFYTAMEGNANTQRISNENPPRCTNGFVADYDIKLPVERIEAAIQQMPIKPSYWERSLGGNFRLVWLLEKAIQVDSKDFCVFLQQKAHDWLHLGLLPGLDREAWETPSRLYCNGCEWTATGAPPIPSAVAQAFFVDCGKAYRFKAGDDEQVPLDLVEKALRERYPGFDWPGAFELESQGPTFWIADSVSPASAIVKPGGIFTFSAHADKPFYSWTDLLGSDFTAKFQASAIAKATEDIWWDSKTFWRRKSGIYVSLGKEELITYFKVTCRLSSKPGSNGISPIEAALDHIYNHQHVVGAAPFVCRKSGLIIFNRERKLNTYMGCALPPAAGVQKWGPHGNFPFLSLFLDYLFSPAKQLPYFLAAWRHFYLSALNFDPQPGQNYVLMGGAGVGKTFANRELVGVSVGGFADASDYLVKGSMFNSELIGSPLWVLDDDSPSTSHEAQARVQAMFKKIAANQQMMHNAKYEKATMISWMGRIGCTTNLDFVSGRIIGPLDNSSLDKINLFRCKTEEEKMVFPGRNEQNEITQRELPYLLRWLIDWEPPAEIPRDPRYGFKSYQDGTLLDRNQQGAHTASFKEVLVEFLYGWFADNEEAEYWEGTATFVLKALMGTNNNEFILRHLKLEQVSRFLEQMQRERSIKIEDVRGAHNTRLWRMYRQCN